MKEGRLLQPTEAYGGSITVTDVVPRLNTTYNIFSENLCVLFYKSNLS